MVILLHISTWIGHHLYALVLKGYNMKNIKAIIDYIKEDTNIKSDLEVEDLEVMGL